MQEEKAVKTIKTPADRAVDPASIEAIGKAARDGVGLSFTSSE